MWAARHCIIFLLLSPTSFLLAPAQTSAEENPPAEQGDLADGEPSRWAQPRRVFLAILFLGLLLAFSVLLVYILRSCGPRKQIQNPSPLTTTGSFNLESFTLGFPQSYTSLPLPAPNLKALCLLFPTLPTSFWNPTDLRF